MSYLNLDLVKKHLQVDEDYTEDDEYILALMDVAENSISQHLDIALDELAEDGELPSSITHAMYLMIGNLYANREPVYYGQIVKIPYTYEYLVGLYKHYYIP